VLKAEITKQAAKINPGDDLGIGKGV